MTTNIGISLGWNCYSAMWGVNNNIRDRKENGYNTCPFDIMVTNYPGICECINDDFKYLCDEKYLEIIKHGDCENETVVYNNKYNFSFNHEGPGVANLYITENWEHGRDHFIINNFQYLKERYQQRTNNFVKYLSDPNNTITFIITTWDKTESDMHVLKDILKIKYPDLKYNFVILNDPNPNGKECVIKHLKMMRFTENDEELKRLL